MSWKDLKWNSVPAQEIYPQASQSLVLQGFSPTYNILLSLAPQFKT